MVIVFGLAGYFTDSTMSTPITITQFEKLQFNYKCFAKM